mgnify:CR=1 FL=1
MNLRELMKYLPLIMQYAGQLARYGKYLKFLPLLFTVVAFVKEAERKFREANSGAKKLAWASEQFDALVELLESSGIIPAKLAEALRDGADKIITVIVQIMNATGGIEDDGDDDQNAGKKPDGVPYLKKFPPPVASNHDLLVVHGFAAGSQVCAESENSEWMVVPKGQPTLGAKVLRYVIAP